MTTSIAPHSDRKGFELQMATPAFRALITLRFAEPLRGEPVSLALSFRDQTTGGIRNVMHDDHFGFDIVFGPALFKATRMDNGKRVPIEGLFTIRFAEPLNDLPDDAKLTVIPH